MVILFIAKQHKYLHTICTNLMHKCSTSSKTWVQSTPTSNQYTSKLRILLRRKVLRHMLTHYDLRSFDNLRKRVFLDHQRQTALVLCNKSKNRMVTGDHVESIKNLTMTMSLAFYLVKAFFLRLIYKSLPPDYCWALRYTKNCYLNFFCDIWIPVYVVWLAKCSPTFSASYKWSFSRHWFCFRIHERHLNRMIFRWRAYRPSSHCNHLHSPSKSFNKFW